MTDIYTAPTNGHKITRTSDGGLRINMPGRDYVTGHEPQTLLGGRVESLREYFRDERDRELGQWRSKKDPNFIVVQGNLEYGVTVIDEQSGMNQWVTRGGGDGAARNFVVIAEEYFAEHPEKKPWHDAKPGEVWDLTTTRIPNKVTAWSTFDGVFVDSAQNWVIGTDILEARRIWPESKES